MSQAITQTLQRDRWPQLDATTHYACLEWCPYGMAQRWLVVSSPAALERAEARITKGQQRAGETIAKPLLPLHAKRFETPEAAQAALAVLATSWRYHQVESCRGIAHKP